MQIVLVPGRIETINVIVSREFDASGWYVGVCLTYSQGGQVRRTDTEWYHGLSLVEALSLVATALDTYLGG